MSDSSRERCEIGKVRVNVNGIEISRDFRVWFVGQRSIKGSANVGCIRWQEGQSNPEAFRDVAGKPTDFSISSNGR